MPSRSSSIQPLIPHQSDHKPCTLRAWKLPFYATWSFWYEKKKKPSKQIYDFYWVTRTGIEWGHLLLERVEAWLSSKGMGGVGRHVDSCPTPQSFYATNTRKYANFNLNRQQQQQTKSCLWVEGKRLHTPKPVGVMDMFTTVTAMVTSWCLQSTYVRWYSSNTWHLLCNS